MIFSKKTVLVLFCAFFLSSIFSEPFINSTNINSPFSLDLATDSIITSSILAINGASLMFEDTQNKNISNYSYNIEEINSFDRLLVNPYNSGLDLTGDIFQYASFLSPMILLLTPLKEWTTIGVMYIESFLFTYGTKNLLKNIVNRPRPFMYFSNIPTDYIEDFDCISSFPSGHTAIAFTGAAFSSYVFSTYFNKSKWKIPVIIGSYTLATTTAILRIASGNHFLTDVITGAIIGTLSGFGIPYIHRFNQKNENITLSLTPISCSLSINFSN